MKKFENFCQALDNLRQIERYSAPYDTVVETGLVALFEICFEQAWKAMKEVLEYHGYDPAKTGSPRMVIKLAYSAGMLRDEAGWLQALAARHNVSHSYNEAIALQIIRDTRERFLPLFAELRAEIETNWIS